MPRPPTSAAPDPSVSVVAAASPDLDDAAATTLLRWCQARLHLFDNGEVAIDHLILDLSHARRTATSAVAILDHARDEADRRHVRIHLVGAEPIMAVCSPSARHRLGRWSSYPTLDAAWAALDPPPTGDQARHPPVDPDALVLPPISTHERLR